MKIGSCDLNKDVFIIAEIGNNHEGSYTMAEELIGLAAQTGVHAVKFQTFIPDRLVSEKEKERIRQLRRFQLSYDQFAKLKKVADRAGVVFLSTPFDIESALFLNDLVPAFKIASGDNNFFPLIEAVAKTGKPIILSAGMTSYEKIKTTKNFIERIWEEHNIAERELAILHCVVNYPTAVRNANLLFIKKLYELGVTVGYSDHTIGISAALHAVVLGARIIEKHFTSSKSYSDFRDHEISADPDEMKSLVINIHETMEMLGDGEKRVLEDEEALQQNVRRSIVAGKDLDRGTIIAMEHLNWVRPGIGLPPGSEGLILGKALKRSLTKGELILQDYVTE
ncbi:MAG TPA: N-acetylneuraminate synthase family protein [Syntrophorhabdaceae bacterium]|nr:N-acetylneuraminate synthase family protein [Syntrophorhabdaceae bacterium]